MDTGNDNKSSKKRRSSQEEGSRCESELGDLDLFFNSEKTLEYYEAPISDGSNSWMSDLTPEFAKNAFLLAS